MKFGTKAIHAGVEPEEGTGAIMTPIYQTSTYIQQSVGNHKGYEYSRTANPTRTALQENLAALENGKHGAVFGSGLGAIDAILKMFRPGDEIISGNDLYGGTYRIFKTVFEPFGIKFHFTEMDKPEKVEALVNDNTKMIWTETPTNPMMNIVDIGAMAEISKKHGILLGVDNTFATPYLQTPLDMGADFVMHSVTKYLGGHSDVVMGAIVTNDDKIASEMARIVNSTGAVAGPMDCFLVLRGIKTLHLRMKAHCENAAACASHLKNHSKVDKVYWPGFVDHPNHDIAKKQMRDFGGMISITLKDDSLRAAMDVLERFKVFSLAESLGGVESLVSHPATMTHAAIPLEDRLKSGVRDSLIRISVGVEDISDLIDDLDQALQ